jgi:single-stranded DNA-binding protein
VSLNRDEFYVRIRGNVVQDPKLVGDNESVCVCKIATNPRARRVDPRTQEEIPDEKRNATRTFLDMRFERPAMAAKFAENIHKGNRIWIEGEAETSRREKLFWSDKEQDWVPVTVDIDGDGKRLEQIIEERIVVRVQDFGRIVNQDGEALLEAI